MGSAVSYAESKEFCSVLDYLPPGDAAAVLSVRARVHTDRDVAEDYIVLPNNVLGKGLNGEVKVCKSRDKVGRHFALKVFSKNAKEMESFRNEILIFLEMDHPNVARLYDVYETKYQLSLVMEYCRGGELYDQVLKSKHFTEVYAQRATRQMMRSVSYLHHKNIVHRDIKMENFLYRDNSENASLVLIDFGFSMRWANHAIKMKKGCGSLMYVAPEVIRKSYTNKCDLWSMGVIVYVLITGTPPFWGHTHKGTLRHICEGQVSTRGGNWDLVSSNARKFVRALLTRNPANRPNAEQALEMPWLVDSSQCTLGVEVLEGLREFAEAQKFRRAALTILAWTVRAPERKKVEHLFLALDKGKEGYVNLAEFQFALRQEFSIDHAESARLFDAVTHGTKMHYTDFLAAMVNHRIEVSEEIVTDAFSRFDVGHTGFIRTDDLRHVLGDTFEHEDVNEMISAVTEDPRGISYEVFVDVLKEKEHRCLNMHEVKSSGSVTSLAMTEKTVDCNDDASLTETSCSSRSPSPCPTQLGGRQIKPAPLDCFLRDYPTALKSPKMGARGIRDYPATPSRSGSLGAERRVRMSPEAVLSSRQLLADNHGRPLTAPHLFHDTPHNGFSEEALLECG